MSKRQNVMPLFVTLVTRHRLGFLQPFPTASDHWKELQSIDCKQ